MEKVARLERKKKRDNATWTDEQEEASWHVHADDALLTADEPEENMVPQEAYNSLKFSRDCTEYNIPSAPPLQPVKPLYSNAVMVVDKKTSQIFCITTLLFTALHVQGVRGYWIRDRYVAAGGYESLPCADMCMSDCLKTIWTYSSPQGERFDVMTYGRVRTDNTKRAERMSPNHCCSLGIANVTAEDAGEYYCGPGGGEISLSILDNPDPTGRSPGLMMESDEMGKAKKGKSSASLEIPIRLTMFFILLILPVVIGIVHVVKRKRQNVKEPLEDTELQDLK
ncbi:uncharacterized protein LOC121711314 isoform X7 [Alosa sapidissima]|uniref:uncharacterized protein LOC121711314 isoform X7 n=1 Tax=Alosa sapidissima TaxID=34773 RepID=UPI001C09C9C2|nr:uncharacterized protein LOC121711314 isoform X7 [Alosa sapidissima]